MYLITPGNLNKPIQLQSGLGYVEYLVTCLGILFVLFAPLPGQTGNSVVDLVLASIRAFGSNTTLLISLP